MLDSKLPLLLSSSRFCGCELLKWHTSDLGGLGPKISSCFTLGSTKYGICSTTGWWFIACWTKKIEVLRSCSIAKFLQGFNSETLHVRFSSKTYSSWWLHQHSLNNLDSNVRDEHAKCLKLPLSISNFKVFFQSLEGFSTFQIHLSQIKWNCFTKPPLTTTSECHHSNVQTSEAES